MIKRGEEKNRKSWWKLAQFCGHFNTTLGTIHKRRRQFLVILDPSPLISTHIDFWMPPFIDFSLWCLKRVLLYTIKRWSTSTRRNFKIWTQTNYDFLYCPFDFDISFPKLGHFSWLWNLKQKIFDVRWTLSLKISTYTISGPVSLDLGSSHGSNNQESWRWNIRIALVSFVLLPV